MERAILRLGDPRLTEPSEPASDFSRAAAVLRDLKDTLGGFRARRRFGRGISAPQIGESIRVSFIDVGGPRAFLNPRIVHAEGTLEYWDDCFSFPDLLVWVSRADRIRVEYQDMDGASRSLEADGDLSELLQHEFDHLDGILAVHRAKDAKSFCLRSEFEARKLTKWSRRPPEARSS